MNEGKQNDVFNDHLCHGILHMSNQFPGFLGEFLPGISIARSDAPTDRPSMCVRENHLSRKRQWQHYKFHCYFEVFSHVETLLWRTLSAGPFTGAHREEFAQTDALGLASWTFTHWLANEPYGNRIEVTHNPRSKILFLVCNWGKKLRREKLHDKGAADLLSLGYLSDNDDNLISSALGSHSKKEHVKVPSEKVTIDGLGFGFLVLVFARVRCPTTRWLGPMGKYARERRTK